MESYTYQEIAAHGLQLAFTFFTLLAAVVSYCFGVR